MTSSTSAIQGASRSLSTQSTSPSNETSRLSSTAVRLDQLKLQIETGEKNLLEWALSSLECIEGPSLSGSPYFEVKAFERENKCVHLGFFAGKSTYIPIATLEDAHKVRQVVDALIGQYMNERIVRSSLFEIWLTTKHEKMNTDDRDAMLSVYVHRLSDYPEAHIKLVLTEYSQTEKFFPSWAELQSRLDALGGWRAGLLFALRKLFKTYGKAQDD